MGERRAARIRTPLNAAINAVVIATIMIIWLTPVSFEWILVAFIAWIPPMVLRMLRVETPHGDTVDISAPVLGRWRALNSPTSRVPSHRTHGWSQTYAIDLVFDPEDSSRPQFALWSLARRPGAYPAFGEDVVAPIDGEVVRARSFMRDHLSRSSPLGLIYILLVESIFRELFGPTALLGNHIVIRRQDGVHVLVAHLKRGSLLVERGDSVMRGTKIAECGNSGNSTEPHVHIQAMDHASVWIAAGLPMTFDQAELPANDDLLLTDASRDDISRESASPREQPEA